MKQIEADPLELHHISFSYYHILQCAAWISYIQLSRMQILLPVFWKLRGANTNAMF